VAARLQGLWVRIPLASWNSVGVVCCQAEVSAAGLSLVQRSPTECGVSECDREASTLSRPWPTGGCRATKKVFFNVKIMWFSSKIYFTHNFLCKIT